MAKRTKLHPTVHEFHSSGSAYDACQCRDDVRTGDVLVIPSEGVVGLAHTWPIAITAESGKLHHADPDKPAIEIELDGKPIFTVEQVRAAVAEAERLGLTLCNEIDAGTRPAEAADPRRADVDAAIAAKPITRVPAGKSGKPAAAAKRTTIGDGSGRRATVTVNPKPRAGRGRRVDQAVAKRVAAAANTAPKRTAAKAAATATAAVVKLDDARAKRKPRGTDIAPKPAGQQSPARVGSCQAALIDALARGATFEELCQVVPSWKPASVRSALHYDIRHLRGYGVRTEPRDGDGELIYRLVLPDGMVAPLAHVEPQQVAKAANKR